MPCELQGFFYSDLQEQPCVSPGNCFHYLFTQPQGVSSHTCADQYLAEDSRGILYRSLQLFLFAAHSCLVLQPFHSSCLGLPRRSAALASIHKDFWAPRLSLNYNLEIPSVYKQGQLQGSHLSVLSRIIVFHCLVSYV